MDRYEAMALLYVSVSNLDALAATRLVCAGLIRLGYPPVLALRIALTPAFQVAGIDGEPS